MVFRTDYTILERIQTGLSDFGKKSRKGAEAQSWNWGAKQNRKTGFHPVLAVDPLQLIGFTKRYETAFYTLTCFALLHLCLRPTISKRA